MILLPDLLQGCQANLIGLRLPMSKIAFLAVDIYSSVAFLYG